MRMNNKKHHGKMSKFDEPVWQPLLDLAPELIDDFMWMFGARLHDGTELHAYKHIDTRRYIHLTEDGRAMVFIDKPEDEEGWSEYAEADPDEVMEAVLAPLSYLTPSR